MWKVFLGKYRVVTQVQLLGVGQTGGAKHLHVSIAKPQYISSGTVGWGNHWSTVEDDQVAWTGHETTVREPRPVCYIRLRK